MSLVIQAAVRPARMAAPKVDAIKLVKEQRPIDHGHCLSLLQEKYGDVRGQESYDFLGDHRGDGALFSAATKIVKEKVKMLEDMKSVVPRNLDEFHWYQLWLIWTGLGLHLKAK